MSAPPHPRTRELIERLRERPMRTDLEPVRDYVSRHVNLPGRTRVVQVVGSNGKGSFVQYARQLFDRRGTTTTSYTSPHLNHPRERIHRGTRPLSAGELESILNRFPVEVFDSLTPFELLFLACLHEAESTTPDVLLLEAGMGGRWDATSALPAEVTVLTSLDLEHTEHLGSTRPEILREKTAQIPGGSRLLHPDLPGECRSLLEEIVAGKNLRASRFSGPGPDRALRRGARSLVRELSPGADPGEEPDLNELSRPPCRQERREHGTRTVLLDGAHTPAALEALLKRMARENPPGWGLLMGVLQGKSTGAMKSLIQEPGFPLHLVLTRAPSPRGVDPDTLAREWGSAVTAAVRPDPRDGWETLVEQTDPDWGLAVAGSFTLAAEVRPWTD